MEALEQKVRYKQSSSDDIPYVDMNFSHKNNKISSGLGIVAKDSSLNNIKGFPT
jgi:hypothetical protein